DAYGYVIFDYSYIELDETTYSGLMSQYEDYIISQYQDYIRENNDDLFSDVKPGQNIAYYENFIIANFDDGENVVDEIREGLYTALYYTFTLYDSAAYVPFNNETAQEDETGYAFTMSDYEETLAYFSYRDESSKLYTTFIDYATVDQEIEVNRISSSEEEEEEESSTNAWILAASIVLVVALLATLISMLVREIMKRHRINTSAKRNAKNQYTKKERLVREYPGPAGTGSDGGDAVI
ncbi:MAG: hypothetical protein LUD47_03190, partial [Clostridia bacterium]|nr:hypothetical protein [Clostridia bacterium]